MTRILRITLKYKFVKPLTRRSEQQESAARPVCGARRALKLFSTLSEHLICHESSTKAHESSTKNHERSTKNHERSTMQKQLLLLGFNALPKNILIFPTFPKRFTLPTFPRHPKKFTQRSPSRVLTAVADSHRRFL